MPQKKLTTLSIPTLPPGEWFDSVLPGLIVRVGVKRRTWQFRYHAGGAYHRKSIGHFPAMELAEARDAARKLIERIDRGAPAEPVTPHPRASTALTLGGLIDLHEKTRLREGHRIKRLPKAMRALRRNLKPWLGLPASEFSKADLRAARDTLIEADTPVEANRLLAAVSAMLRWASQEDLVEANVASAIRRTPEQKRSRVLSKKEIAAIWKACENFGPHWIANSYARLVRFLLLTGQRRSEAASLKFGDILDGTWRQVENKAMRPHALPLPPLALALVGQGDARDLVFPGRRGPMNGFTTWKKALDEASGVSDWVLHDVRRSVASGLQDIGIRHDVVSAILNHSLKGVAQVYLRSELEQQKAAALALWADEVIRIVKPVRLVSA